jgi:PhnB protein
MTTPPGFATVTPYIFADNAPSFCRFLVEGLGAEEISRDLDGERIANAQFRLGNGMIMVSEAGRGFGAMSASYYLYVDDAHAAQQRAIAAGATEVSPVRDQSYGDRQGGVRDPHGNYWWISQRLVDGEYQ